MNDCVHVSESGDGCVLFPVECKNPVGKGCYLSETEKNAFLDRMRKGVIK
jgi:hypothetical protein